MLYLDRIDVSKEIDINKTSASKNVIFFTIAWYFLNKGFKFQPHVCNGCHGVLLFWTLTVLIITVLSMELAKEKP